MEDVSQSIKSASVCHTEADVLDSLSCGLLYQVIFFITKIILNPEIIESSPSTPNLLLVLSLSFKKLLKDSTLANYFKIPSLYSLLNLVCGICSISFISHAFYEWEVM